MNFNFGEVLTRAWQITWKYKVLWIFGILASCSRGGGGSGGGGSGGGGGGDGSGPYDPNSTQRVFDEIGHWINENWWIVALIIVAFIVLILLSIFLGTIGRIGLIRGTLQAEAGAESLAFGELFSGSMPYFWRVFGLSFLIGLIILLFLIPLFLFGTLTAGIGFLCILPLLCLLIPVSIAIYLIIELANVAIVKENMSLWDGWKRGWELVRANVGTVILMGLILFIISFAIGIAIAIPILIVVVPAVLGMSAGQFPDTTTWIIAGVCFAAFLPVAILVNGVYFTFSGATWTLTYNRLTAKPETLIVPPTEANA